MSSCNELQPNQQRALELMSAGATTIEVARELGVDRTTVWRWSQSPQFATALARSFVERRAALANAVEAVACRALDALVGVLTDEAVSPAIRVRAADVVLKRAWVGDVERLIPQLEQRGGNEIDWDRVSTETIQQLQELLLKAQAEAAEDP